MRQRILSTFVLLAVTALVVAQGAPTCLAAGTGWGTGFVVSADGYILTNEHVVHGASSVTVYIENVAHEAEVVGSTEEWDLALLKIAAAGLSPVSLGNSTILEAFDEVVALGYPIPQFGRDLTVSRGTITSIRTNVAGREGRDTIQHDAVIFSGSSGGPLFNMSGEVVGVNYSIVEGSGLMFTIPITDALPLLRMVPGFGVGDLGRAAGQLAPQEIVERYRASVVLVEVQIEADIGGLIPESIPGYPYTHSASVDTQGLAQAGFGVEAAAVTWSYKAHAAEAQACSEAPSLVAPTGGYYSGALVVAVLFETAADAGRASNAGILQIASSAPTVGNSQVLSEPISLEWNPEERRCWLPGTWRIGEEASGDYWTRLSAAVMYRDTVVTSCEDSGEVITVPEMHMPRSVHCPCSYSTPSSVTRFCENVWGDYVAFEGVALLRAGALLIQVSTYFADCRFTLNGIFGPHFMYDDETVTYQDLILRDEDPNREIIVHVEDLLSEFESVMEYAIIHVLEQLAAP